MSTKTTRRKKSAAMKLLENISGEPLSFASLINSIRQCEEISQVAFAKKLGISRSHLCDIEKGRKSVSPARAAQFAQVLEYSTDQFVRLALQDQLDRAGLNIKVELKVA